MVGKYITFFKGKQITWFPEKGKIIEIPHQKGAKPGDEIIIDKILEKDKEFGQPYLPIKLIGKVIREGKNQKIHGMKYKSKKRTKKTWSHQEQWTEIEIVSIKEK